MKKKNNNWTTVFLVLLLLAGVSLLLYPSLSDYWNSMHQTRAIASYAETVSQLDTAQYDEMWKAAQDYNRSLAQRETAFALTDEQKAAYESLLDVSRLGVMGYIEIPTIKVSLPILLFIYPIAITIVIMTILNKFAALSRTGMRLTVAVAALISAIDILHQFAGLGWAGAIIKSLPLHESSLAWLLPVLAALVLSLVLPGKKIRGETELELH